MLIKKPLSLILIFVLAISATAQQNDTDPYKGSDQLIVFDSTFVQMTESGLCYTRQHIRYKALSVKGAKQLAALKFDYEPLSADVQIKSAQILKVDGKSVKLEASKVIDYAAPARAIYWGARQKMLAVGRIAKNDMVDVVLSRKGFTYALLKTDDEERFIPPMRGEFYEIINFFGNEPIQTKYYEVSIPAHKTVQYKTYNGTINVNEQKRGDNRVFTFVLNNIFPIKSEPNMVALSDIAPKAIITTTMKWEDKSKWFYGVNESYGSFTCTPELKVKVDELLRGSKTELDSIHALTHWVADNMRYSGLTMGKGEGYTLHNVKMNFTDRCGVCKDKASLLVAMLRAAGFKTYAAMTMAGSRIENIPADQFNHSVTAVVLRNGQIQMLDPTWVPFSRELWSSLEQQQNYLIGTAEGLPLMETPISAPENHYLNIDNKATLDEEGNLTGTFTIDAEGQSDGAIRGILTGPAYRRDKAIEKELRKYNSKLVVTSFSGIDDPYTYSQPVHLVINYQIPNYVNISDKEISFQSPLSSGFFKSQMWHLGLNTTVESRKYAFKTRCTQLIKQTETITLPASLKVKQQPVQLSDITDSAGSISTSSAVNGSTYSFKNTISMNKRIFEANDWTVIRSIVEQHKKIMDQKLLLEK